MQNTQANHKAIYKITPSESLSFLVPTPDNTFPSSSTLHRPKIIINQVSKSDNFYSIYVCTIVPKSRQVLPLMNDLAVFSFIKDRVQNECERKIHVQSLSNPLLTLLLLIFLIICFHFYEQKNEIHWIMFLNKIIWSSQSYSRISWSQ